MPQYVLVPRITENSDENGRERTKNTLTVPRPIFFHRKRERERGDRERNGKRDKRVYENEQMWMVIQQKRAGIGTTHRDDAFQPTLARCDRKVPSRNMILLLDLHFHLV
jgi:hypothetical protein